MTSYIALPSEGRILRGAGLQTTPSRKQMGGGFPRAPIRTSATVGGHLGPQGRQGRSKRHFVGLTAGD